MPLLTGTWTLFMDGVSAALDVSNIDASGRFHATLAGTAVSVLTNG